MFTNNKNLLHEVSSNNFHTKTPRTPVFEELQQKPQTLVVEPSFTGISTPTGKIGQMQTGEFETHLETLYMGVTTHTFHNPEYARALVVVQGSGFVHVNVAGTAMEDKIAVQQSSIITIPVNASYRLSTTDRAMTVAYISDIDYSETVEVLGNTEVASPYSMPQRRELPDQSKTRAALLANANKLNDLTNTTLNGHIVKEGESFDVDFAPQGENVKPLKFENPD